MNIKRERSWSQQRCVGFTFLLIQTLILSSCGWLRIDRTDLSSKSTYPDCLNGAVTVDTCVVKAPGFGVTSAIGSNVTVWSNPSANSLVSGVIPDGFYLNRSVEFADANLLPQNIAAGFTIFGVAGTFIGASSVVYASNMSRDSSTPQMTLNDEAVVSAGTAYTQNDPGYRAIPKIAKDDDGSTGTNVTKVNRTGWAATTCGLTGTIEQRILNCSTNPILGPNATWDGASLGNAGHGVWKLVTRTGSLTSGRGREVWRDERTKLLWSSLVSSATNWCKASGSNFIPLNPSSEDDPSNICDSNSYQSTTAPAVSACYEDPAHFTEIDPEIDPDGKGLLNLSSSPSVAWRLPTYYDYNLANLNGLRFVVPELPGTSEWTATLRAANRSQAHAFDPVGGDSGVPSRSNNGVVRCVGR